jgi:hypothetical protein
MIARLILFLKDRGAITLSEWIQTRSYAATPNVIKPFLIKLFDRPVLKWLRIPSWFNYLFVHGFGNSFIIYFIFVTVLVNCIVLEGMKNLVGKPVEILSYQNTVGFLMYIPLGIYTVVSLLLIRMLYSLAKENEYLDRMDAINLEIEAAQKNEDKILGYLLQERDRMGWRCQKQWRKIGPAFALLVNLAFQFIAFIGAAINALQLPVVPPLDPPTDIDFAGVIIPFVITIILPFGLMQIATKAPLLTRSALGVMDNIPLEWPGYLVIRHYHSAWIQELPAVFSNICLTVTSWVGVILITIQPIIISTVPGQVSLVFFLIGLPGLFSSTLSLIYVIIVYPIYFLILNLACRVCHKKKVTPKE